MSLLLDATALAARRALASGPLAPLADSLAEELGRLLPSGDPFIPPEKAKLTRAGGRCARDGTLLEFDPRQPRQHRCPHCGASYEGEAHYRWWVMGYQLWLAERAVQAAALWALRGATRHRHLAEAILSGLAERYNAYPNADNVLGPSRLFFSTYLESIWLLQVAAALDVLESAGGTSPLGGAVRDRIVEPSAQLIASYDEADSNRQVWNNAAIAAAGQLLGRPEWTERAVFDPSGLAAHLARGLLPDGTWYEGENYHLFAHRGLWYGVSIAERAGLALPSELVARFEHAFATPFLTALPDFTFPARRDSQYGVSLRQWRIAEMCELGLARRADDRLACALGELYRADVPEGDVARWRSTADAERNVPGARLTRADLGWKSLLFMDPAARVVEARVNASSLLEGQGIAVLRREMGRVYVALDYGVSGGGHGHPDRLNLWLVNGDQRVLEDVGTGSYVDPTLHWYRSTLAHNAPLVSGRSQDRVDGVLSAWDEHALDGWVRAEADVAPGVSAVRTVVVRDSYLVDVVEWRAAREVTLDVPLHLDADAESVLGWRDAPLPGSDAQEDGFRFVEHAERASSTGTLALRSAAVRGWVVPAGVTEWWRCLAPGPPGHSPRRFYLARSLGAAGRLVSLWSWGHDVCSVEVDGVTIVARRRDGARDAHTPTADGWQIREVREDATHDIWLRGLRAPRAPHRPAESSGVAPAAASYPVPLLPPHLTLDPGDLTLGRAAGRSIPSLRFRLGERHYRHAEPSWREAGAPEALVSVAASREHLIVEVSVRKAELCFAPPRHDNPLDNEHPDINSDGLQLHLSSGAGAERARGCVWLIVPERGSSALRITPRSAEAAEVALAGSWRRTAQGYAVLLRIPRAACELKGDHACRMDLIVNEISAGRERRRGQLVLSGGRGEWVYLRGDRQETDRFLTFALPDA